MNIIFRLRLMWHQLSEQWHRETAYLARQRVREAESAAERAEAKQEELLHGMRWGK